jgi:predicted phosphodiesterase
MEETILKLLNLLGKERELNWLCNKLEVQDYEILGLIEKLKLDGHNIDVYQQNKQIMIKSQANKVIKTQNKYELYDGRLKKIRFALISDTHLCSKQDQPAIINALYDEFEKRNIRLVLHCGDISDGFYKNRPEHIFQLKAFGSDEQAEYIIEKYPKRDKIRTLFITGNHDHTHIKNGGTDIGRAIARERDDMEYLGIDFAEVIINNCKIHLYHPAGGSAYARSYKLQKFIDAMRGGEKPNILAQGHYHKTFYMFYRNIHAFSIPSVQGYTPFMRSFALGNDMGAWIIEAKVDKQGNVISLIPELIPVYESQEKKTSKVLVK